jgi:hypothetical protein
MKMQTRSLLMAAARKKFGEIKNEKNVEKAKVKLFETR